MGTLPLVKRVVFWLVAVLLVIGIGVGIEVAVTSGSHFGTITGEIIQVGGKPGPGGRTPQTVVAGEVTFIYGSSDAPYYVMSTTRQGYSIQLPAGIYDFDAYSLPTYAEAYPMKDVPVVVTAGSTSHLNFYVHVR